VVNNLFHCSIHLFYPRFVLS